MSLEDMLRERRDAILAEAAEALRCHHLRHYMESGEEANRERLTRLYDLARDAIAGRSLVPMIRYSEAVAEERFRGGFPLQEVQVGYNVLEEAVWRAIEQTLPAAEYPRAFGLIATVLGAGREALAVRFVELASRTRVPSLDLTSLFEGV